MEYFSNPIAHPDFLFPLFKTAISLLGGLVLMLLMYIKNPKELFKTLIWKKFCSWLLIVPFLFIIICSGIMPFYCFVAFLMIQGGREFINMSHLSSFYRKLFWINQLVSLVIAILLPASIDLLPIFYFLIIFVGVSLHNQVFEGIKNVSSVLLGNLWVGYSLTMLLSIYKMQAGTRLLILLFGIVILSDVLANLIGKMFKMAGIGTRPLASNISPNKIQAGVLGNIGGAGMAFLMYGLDFNFHIVGVLLVIILTGIMAVVGDLAESFWKRCAKVKDSGTFLGSHGGLLDRIDSFIFGIIVFYMLFNINELKEFF